MTTTSYGNGVPPELKVTVIATSRGALIVNQTMSGLAAKHFLVSVKDKLLGNVTSGPWLKAGVMSSSTSADGKSIVNITSNYDVNVSPVGRLTITLQGRPCPCGAKATRSSGI